MNMNYLVGAQPLYPHNKNPMLGKKTPKPLISALTHESVRESKLQLQPMFVQTPAALSG